jgi:hypothetical protein
VGKIKRVFLILIAICLLMVVMAGLSSIGKRNGSGNETVNLVLSPTPVEFQDKWGIFESEKGGFKTKVPADWEAGELTADENFVVRVIIKPGSTGPVIGNVEEISISVVNKPQEGQLLSTAKEFTEWMKKPDMASGSGGETKLNSGQVAGLDALNIVDKYLVDGKEKWTILTWFRKNSTNYYLATVGNGKYTGAEAWLHNSVVSGFEFTE